MDLRYLAHLDADPDFYDDSWRGAPPPGSGLGPTAVPPGVVVGEVGPWRVYRTPGALPDEGWKVHVSCVPHRARRVVALAVTAALRQGVSCKHLRDRRLVLTSQAKYAEPTGAGKVVTLYPPTTAHLESLVGTLVELLAGEPGARVLSDVPVAGAPVSVRHGAFVGVHHLDDRGRCVAGLRRGEGATAVDDRSPHSAGRATAPSCGPTRPRAVWRTCSRCPWRRRPRGPHGPSPDP